MNLSLSQNLLLSAFLLTIGKNQTMNSNSFFLLVALITTSTLRLISATETPPPSSPPTQPPPPEEIPQNQITNIIDALLGAGDFAGWANLVSSTDLPVTATLFIPTNAALSQLPSGDPMGINLDPFLISYHIIPQRLTFSDLQQFRIHTRLPTLFPSKCIIITNNSISNFTIDDSQITHPDIFINPAFSVHGIKSVLDYSVFGGGVLPPPPAGNTTSGGHIWTPKEFPGEIAFDPRSDAAACLLCGEISKICLVVFCVVFCVVFLFKIL